MRTRQVNACAGLALATVIAACTDAQPDPLTLNGPAVGLAILAYTLVSLENHHPETIREFDQLVQDRPEILECHSMSGPNDYLLRIVAASMEAYERFMSANVLQIKAVRAVNTSFVLRTKKYTTRLPVV